MEEYTILEIDFEKGIIRTMEGRKFIINIWDISVMVGWCPTEKLILIEYNSQKVLKHYSGGMVRLR